MNVSPEDWNKMTPEAKVAFLAKLNTDEPKPPVDSSRSIVTWILYILTRTPALCVLGTRKILEKGGMEAFGVFATVGAGFIAFTGVFVFGIIILPLL